MSKLVNAGALEAQSTQMVFDAFATAQQWTTLDRLYQMHVDEPNEAGTIGWRLSQHQDQLLNYGMLDLRGLSRGVAFASLRASFQNIRTECRRSKRSSRRGIFGPLFSAAEQRVPFEVDSALFTLGLRVLVQDDSSNDSMWTGVCPTVVSLLAGLEPRIQSAVSDLDTVGGCGAVSVEPSALLLWAENCADNWDKCGWFAPREQQWP